jgi:3-oxoacid CoA-transferase subunit A/glutaconate CoA-transferase subunit A
MDVIVRGEGNLIGWHDPDEHREWVRKNKSRRMNDKRMDVDDAVSKFIKDGDFIASGGFGHVRVSMSVIYEIIRQRKKNLVMAGKTAVHDIDLLVASGSVNQVEVAYSFGHELKGLSPASRRRVQNGECKVVAEITNAAYQWRFLAGMMGIPFIPARNMMGTDTFKKSSSKIVKCPFSGKDIVLIPSANPDVAFIHVHRADKYGNAQIEGITIEDFELARASRRLIITAEEIVDNELIREKPYLTTIPYYIVDAVIEVKYGSHPCNMPYRYYFDENQIDMWLKMSKTDDGVKEYLNKYVYDLKDFSQYLNLIGGEKRMKKLMNIENLDFSVSSEE